MTRFMALYVATADDLAKWNALDEETRKEREVAAIRAWHAWNDKHKAAIVDEGSPLGKTKRTDASGVRDVTNPVSGYTIIEAESHEAAARMFKNHPHFSILPGNAVEIMPCTSIPTL